MINNIDKEKLNIIKELLGNYSDDCIAEATNLELNCTNCMTGKCSDCYTPYKEEAHKCYDMIDYIDELLRIGNSQT